MTEWVGLGRPSRKPGATNKNLLGPLPSKPQSKYPPAGVSEFLQLLSTMAGRVGVVLPLNGDCLTYPSGRPEYNVYLLFMNQLAATFDVTH